ncbi:MAG TPA: hypothetical protein VF314_01380 [Actinomycetes bacterium]
MKRRAWVLIAGLCLGLPMAGTQAASAEPAWRGLPAGTQAGPALQACLDTAQRERPERWVCLGGQLTTTTRDAAGRQVSTTRIIARDVIEDTTATAPGTPDTSGGSDFTTLSTDDYDTWCESGTTCGRLVTSQIAEVKGNGAYGDSSGNIGNFDQVLRQSFNGAYPRWRALIIWDGGPRIISLDWRIHCRIQQTGPDGYCGSTQFLFSSISSSSWRAWYPSSTDYSQNSTKLQGSTNYHDDYYGKFSAEGYATMAWYTGTLHTGRWYQCASSIGCKYYQVPWKA